MSIENIRFAPIPRCASRTLKELGLLGEFGRFHSRIINYPMFHKFVWYRVDRDPQEWLESWWFECREHVKELAETTGKTIAELRSDGMRFTSMEDDLRNITVETLQTMPAPLHVNAWLTQDVICMWPEYQAAGRTLYDLCIDSICGAQPCIKIQIEELDNFVIKHGLTPVHLNAEALNA